MYCTSCGAALPRDARFCPSCGAEVASGPTTATPAGETFAEPKKKMALWKKIALGLVAFVAVALALAFLLTAGLVEPIDRQLAAFKAGDVDAAYAETSIAYRKTMSKAQFADFLRANPALREVTDRTFTTRSRENDVGTVKGTLKTAEGGVIPVEYRLVQENGAWKILSLKLGDGG